MASNDSDIAEGSAAAPADAVAPVPVIGISCYLQQAQWGVWDTEAALVPADYVRMVAAAGGIPVLLPPHGQTPAVLDRLDGLLIAGGADVDPAAYGAAAHERTGSQPFRDDSEFLLLAAARQRGLPVLGICRGLQVIAVAHGSTLIQHLPEVTGHTDYQPRPGVYGEVAVTTEPGTIARAVLGETATAPCYHHQAVDRLGAGLTVTARSAEGLIEAIEIDPAHRSDDGTGWLFAVQWHPEHNPDDARVVTALVDAAKDRLGAPMSMTAPA
ncbi:gamma-glutamyl-gamma-aminobutyrate hydrolase family protein [Brevibacterium casei]|uniref:gamma-glutamyl-gamma-aminobutyrate hydrolase family protein n=1 Tax=Brevibacterium casei TaxID=33889 RepID=UPI00223B3925|nr:gamma-glutamyl-gamma-aminobutyrate hydrolase family protein [Brevibacterium casei]MCT1447042.1 gamma-glutamyl-gamma-aminobutyrate hydrolase family protein [Brevibacterium casei]